VIDDEGLRGWLPGLHCAQGIGENEQRLQNVEVFAEVRPNKANICIAKSFGYHLKGWKLTTVLFM
jgi:hypothetical protein